MVVQRVALPEHLLSFEQAEKKTVIKTAHNQQQRDGTYLMN